MHTFHPAIDAVRKHKFLIEAECLDRPYGDLIAVPPTENIYIIDWLQIVMNYYQVSINKHQGWQNTCPKHPVT